VASVFVLIEEFPGRILRDCVVENYLIKAGGTDFSL